MSMLYEIVELPTGEIVLKRVEDDDSDDGHEPLVVIRFSEEAEFFLDDSKIDVAKAMIEAGLNVAGNMSLEDEGVIDVSEDELLDDDEFEDDDPTVH